MAVGDIVSAVYTTSTTFQPAATVQIAITTFLTNGSTNNKVEGRGTINMGAFTFSTPDGSENEQMKLWSTVTQGGAKFLIDNASYIHFDNNSTSSDLGFIGIQTQ